MDQHLIMICLCDAQNELCDISATKNKGKRDLISN